MPWDALKRLWLWQPGFGHRLTSAMSSAARLDPTEAPEERRFLRSARDGDAKDHGRDAARSRGHHGLGKAGRRSHGQDGSE